MNIYYNTARLIIRIFHLIFSQDCRVCGDLNFPSGAKIIAGNHPNATDGLFLPFVFQEMLHFFVQGDLFEIPFVGWLLAKSEQIPVIPGQKQRALELAAKLLEQDKVVALFPEARLNPEVLSVKSGIGAVRLSLMTKAPIIPVGFYVPPQNLRHITRMMKGRVSAGNWQTHGHCTLHIGVPWLPGEEISGSVDQDNLRELTEQLMGKIDAQAFLARQDYAKETGLPISVASHEGS
jgi:1-acyl-sn-glycerol-3-phosphate acyltransferase